MVFSGVQGAHAAGGLTISGSGSFTGYINTALSINDLQIVGDAATTTPVKLLVTSGTLAMATTTGLTFTGGQTGSTLYFSGTVANLNAALASLTYTRGSTGTDTLEVSLVPQGEVFFGGNGHLYEYVSDTQTWTSAKTLAEARSKYGAPGYLTTITSAEENAFVAARLANAGWMGASDSASEGAWKWVTGPENGTTFWNGASGGSVVPGAYANWGTGEPNDSGGNEDCAQFLSGGSGQWNDLPCTLTTLPGYVVEYGATSTMPTVTAKNISLTTQADPPPTVTIDPLLNGKRFGSATTTISATASDNGTVAGVQFRANNTAIGTEDTGAPYSADWNPAALAEGAYVIAAVARDNVGNYATSTATVTVDHTAPVLAVATVTPSVLSSSVTSFSYTAAFNDTVDRFWSCDPDAIVIASQATSTGVNILLFSDLVFGRTYQCEVWFVDAAGNASNRLRVGPFTRSAVMSVATAYVPAEPLVSATSSDEAVQTAVVSDTVPSSTPPAPKTGHAFPRDLWKSLTGADVKELQILLNGHGHPLAAAGVGSPGNETEYFGSLTENALSKFQAENGIAPAAGYFGRITRAFIEQRGY